MDIRDDVLEECSKYGPIYHIHVDKVTPQGMVYVKASSPDAATKASQALHGRWFAGNVPLKVLLAFRKFYGQFTHSVCIQNIVTQQFIFLSQ